MIFVHIDGESGPTPPSAFTWNSADTAANIAFSNGDRTITKVGGADAYGVIRSTLIIPDGGYAEVVVNQGTSSPFMTIGLANGSQVLDNFIGSGADGWSYYQETGTKITGGAGVAYGDSYTTADVIGIAYKNGKVYFANNNVWQGGGDPASETGEAFAALSGGIYIAAALYRGSSPAHQLTLNATALDLVYPPPAGYSAAGA